MEGNLIIATAIATVMDTAEDTAAVLGVILRATLLFDGYLVYLFPQQANRISFRRLWEP
jgi:hypothetical protein